MLKSLAHRLFGLGKVPAKYRVFLQEEGILLEETGLAGTITLKNFRGPGRRHSWKRNWFTGSILISHQTFAAFNIWRPLIYVPFADERFLELHYYAQDDDLVVNYDAALFNEQWSGSIKCRFSTSRAKEIVELLDQKRTDRGMRS